LKNTNLSRKYSKDAKFEAKNNLALKLKLANDYLINQDHSLITKEKSDGSLSIIIIKAILFTKTKRMN